MPETREVSLPTTQAQLVCGRGDEHLARIESLLGIEIVGRGNILKIKGERAAVRQAAALIERLAGHAAMHGGVETSDILRLMAPAREGTPRPDSEAPSGSVRIDSRRSVVVPHSPKQRAYIEAIRSCDLTVGIGPAGTGKTYLAVACAIELLKQGAFRRIILTRPALEAGERLGFLPGDLEEKIKPYLQPIYDALYDLVKYEEIRRWTERRIIEVVPLAYMRGRTLSEAFIILDEAQNTTFEQMKMFLTRMGINSRVVVTGDITQIDLPLTRRSSGLVDIQLLLKGVRGIRFVYFGHRDVVRHRLVKDIVNAYARRARTADLPDQPGQPPAEAND